MVDLSRAPWRNSAGSGGNRCVEVDLVDGQIAVRDSKDHHRFVLFFTAHEWEAFFGGTRDGEFELLRLEQLTEPTASPAAGR